MIALYIVRKRCVASEPTIYNHAGISTVAQAFMGKVIQAFCVVLALSAALSAQGKRLWVLRSTGEIAEYDPTTFAARHIVKVPPEAAASPQSFSVNHLGQMLFTPAVSLPLAEGDLTAEPKVWFFDGRAATTLAREVTRNTATAGSNLVISESASTAYLAADGSHLYWFANQARRMQRDGVDLSTQTAWVGWQTDLAGAGRQDV